MPDSFTENTSRSLGGRLSGSIGGVFVGALMAIVAIPLLFWNEGRAIKMTRALGEARAGAIPITADAVAPANDGKLVYLTGPAETQETLSDPQFGISTSALELDRQAQIYQWQEKKESHTEKNLGGSEDTKTTYTYTKIWSAEPINSSEFKDQAGHANPTAPATTKLAVPAKEAHIGAYHLPPELVSKLRADEPLTPSGSDLAKIPDPMRSKAHLNGAEIYLGKDPANPDVGDERVSFKVLRPTTVSLIAQQTGASFQPYATHSGVAVELIQVGTVSAEALVNQAQSENKMLTWIIRAGGFILLFIGFAMLFGPLDALGDIIPFVGSLLRIGTGILAFFGAICVGCVTIAVAWFAYRPLLSASLIAVAIGVVVLTHRARKKAAAALAK
jgi:Transmembrane protein 43